MDTDTHTHPYMSEQFTLKLTLMNLSIRQSKRVRSRGCTLHIPQLIFLWNTTVWPKIWQQRNVASVCSQLTRIRQAGEKKQLTTLTLSTQLSKLSDFS